MIRLFYALFDLFLLIVVIYVMHVQFEFSEIIETIKPLIEHAKTLPRLPKSDIPNYIKSRLFVFPQFPNYIAKVIADPQNLSDGLGYLKLHSLPALVGDDKQPILSLPFNRLANEDPSKPHINPDGIRNSQSYFLNTDELEQAITYLDANPQLLQAASIFQYSTTSYLEGLLEEMRKHYIGAGDTEAVDVVNQISKTYLRNADGPTFMHDMSPVIANALNEIKKDKTVSFDGVLQKIFMKQMFRSSNIMSGDNEYEKHNCPFSGAFAQALSYNFENKGNGAVTASKGKFGDTLISIGSIAISQFDPSTELALEKDMH